jgi:hypothetical protein
MEQKIVFYTKNLIFIMMVRVMVFNATYFRYFMAVSFIGGGNRSTLKVYNATKVKTDKYEK